MAMLSSGYASMSKEEQEESTEEVRHDMELHLGMVNYCLERYDELLGCERENQREHMLVLEQIVHRRLAAALASRF